MNIAELNMIGIGAGEIKIDENISCRVCLASDVKLCDIMDSPRFGNKAEVKPVHLMITVIYIPLFCLYFAKWEMRGDYDPPENHRSIVKPWGGGLWVTVQATEHLKEAISSSIARIVAGKYRGGTDGKTIIPGPSLAQDFKDAGWIEPTPETTPSGQ
jgi:hypothetical protein